MANPQSTELTEAAVQKKSPEAVYRGQELEWRRTHKELLQTFAGEWVVLEGESIISHGTDAARVVAEARAQGISLPYLFRVEPLDEAVVRIGL